MNVRNVMNTTTADREAFDAIARIDPVLCDCVPAADAMDFPDDTLLHAGPPFLPGRTVPPPVLNSAAATIVFEGWAADRREALAMLADRSIRLEAAQDHRCVVPLAAVLSPSQSVQVVRDAYDRVAPTFAAFNGGTGPCVRLGLPGPEVVEHLRWLNGPFADAVRLAMKQRIHLLPIADQALVAGDDCHGRTPAATRLLLDAMRVDEDSDAHRFIAASPSFFLNLWMAAVKGMLSAAEGVAGSSVVTALAGNGVDAGIQLAGRPGVWHRVPASPPVGALLPSFAGGVALPAIGDSAVVDAFGLGAMAFAHSPAQEEALGRFMPAPAAELAAALLYGPHPALPESGARFGLAARTVVDAGRQPVVALGLLDATGVHGRIGGGVWTVPADLFTTAMRAMTLAA